jgi:hypothetical protein
MKVLPPEKPRRLQEPCSTTVRCPTLDLQRPLATTIITRLAMLKSASAATPCAITCMNRRKSARHTDER